MNRVVVATAVPAAACLNSSGDLNLLMGVLNKQDYARWHGYDFVVTTLPPDAQVRVRFCSTQCCSNY